MKNSLPTLGCVLVLTFGALASGTPPARAVSTTGFFGFTLGSEIINPKCVNLLQTWISEKASIIVQSVVLKTCQNSNLAFEGKTYKVDDDGKVSYQEPDDPTSQFSYQVVGRTDNGYHALYHDGYIGIYKIENRDLYFDINSQPKRPVAVLSKIGSTSFLPCIDSMHVDGSFIVIKKAVFDPNQPRAFQCTKDRETMRIEVGK